MPQKGEWRKWPTRSAGRWAVTHPRKFGNPEGFPEVPVQEKIRRAMIAGISEFARIDALDMERRIGRLLGGKGKLDQPVGAVGGQ